MTRIAWGPMMLATLLALAATAVPAAAQAIRISGASSVRYIELRPFVRDSVPQDTTAGRGLLRQLPDGRVVRCIPGEEFCRDTHPGAVVSSIPAVHDLELSVWGLGEGVHLYTHLRARTAWGGAPELWPEGTDAFDVLASFAEIDRPRWRVRAGRQWKVSGLGFYNFDGVAVALRPASVLWVEGYGGRSLLRGLNEPRTTSVLASMESFAPGNAGVLAGVHARYRPTPRLALSALYQIDFGSDRRTVYSELAGGDFVLRVAGGSIEGSIEGDVASGALNEARLRLRSPPIRQVALTGEVRRYRPYFELWTIWGAFSPVGFDEGRGGVTWADPRGRVIVRGEASYRKYGATAVDESADAFRNDGWGLGANVGWSPVPAWRLESSYRVEGGFGAAGRDARAGAVRRFGDGGSVGIEAVLFERLYEFRLAEGTVAGLGAELAMPLSARTRLIASAAAYRHLESGSMADMDWNQRRASVRLQWTLGAEPRPVAAPIAAPRGAP